MSYQTTDRTIARDAGGIAQFGEILSCCCYGQFAKKAAHVVTTIDGTEIFQVVDDITGTSTVVNADGAANITA